MKGPCFLFIVLQYYIPCVCVCVCQCVELCARYMDMVPCREWTCTEIYRGSQGSSNYILMMRVRPRARGWTG